MTSGGSEVNACPRAISVIRQTENMILPLWRKGFNTYEIARALNLREYEVANLLLRLRDQHKQMRGGG